MIKMTNYRKITTKSCEALAEFLTRILDCHCGDCPAYEICKDEIFIFGTSEEFRSFCKKNMMTWLNRESRVNDNLRGNDA